jgi:ribosomal-protein-alanine N-acetyltransferase
MASRLEHETREPVGPAEPHVVIAPMRRRHLRGVLRIESQVYPRPWSSALFAGEMAMVNSRVYIVARVAGVVVGYAGLMLVADDGHVTTIAVDPAWHRQGIASRMLLELARRGARRKVEQLTLEVRLSNAGAQELYRHFGFAPAGIRRGYYVDNGEDALVMWAHDIATPAYAERLAAIEAGIVGTTVSEGFDDP